MQGDGLTSFPSIDLGSYMNINLQSTKKVLLKVTGDNPHKINRVKARKCTATVKERKRASLE